MLAELDQKMRKYELRYEMSSDKMAALLEMDAIRPTAEVLRWYSAEQGAKSIREKYPHDWNSWDHYRTIHEIRLSEHPFVVSDYPRLL